MKLSAISSGRASGRSDLFGKDALQLDCQIETDVTYALRETRATRAGQELTCDYRTFYLESANGGLVTWASPITTEMQVNFNGRPHVRGKHTNRN